MGMMRLSSFFERFDSARDVLSEMSYRHYNGSYEWEDSIASMMYCGDIAFGILGKTKVFGEMKGDVKVLCGGLCYVPSTLMRGIEFAEREMWRKRR